MVSLSEQGAVKAVQIHTHAVVKRMLGVDYVARSVEKVERWFQDGVKLLPGFYKEAFEQIILEGRDLREVAAAEGIAVPTLRIRLLMAFKMMGVAARALPKKRFDELFVSILDHEFGEEVRLRELTEVLLGWYDRRSTQNIAIKWIPAAERGELDLPLPVKKGKFWVFTRIQAERWRTWYIERGESEDGD